MMAESKVIMNLWIDTRSNAVLYAEVGKDCVDFLFNIMSLPIATAIRLVAEQEKPGSVANLYESIKSLNEACMLPERKLFTCVGRHLMTISDDTREVCPDCEQNINLKMTEYVEGVEKYLVMDNLVVKPATVSIIRLFNELGVKDVSVLQEKQVILGSTEAVKLLKTCLHSKNVLTEVFLNQR